MIIVEYMVRGLENNCCFVGEKMETKVMKEKLRRILSCSNRLSALVIPALRFIRKIGRRMCGGDILAE